MNYLLITILLIQKNELPTHQKDEMLYACFPSFEYRSDLVKNRLFAQKIGLLNYPFMSII